MNAVPARTGAPLAADARRWFAPLDGLRAVAALAVLTTHVGYESGAALDGATGGFLSRLDIGVAIFFVLSGFLLHRPYVLAALGAGARPDTRTYLWHRALRVLPALWAALALAALVPENRVLPWTTWTANATFTHVYVPVPAMAGLTQLWSLAVEASFYLLLPWLAALAAGRGARLPRAAALRRQAVVVGACVVLPLGFVALSHTGSLPAEAALWLPAYLDWFAVGMGLAVAHAATSTGVAGRWSSLAVDLARTPWTTWLLAALLVTLAATPVAGPYGLATVGVFESVAKNVLYAVVAGLLLVPCAFAPAGSRGPQRLLATRPLRWLGMISYGIFLYHHVVLDVVRRTLGHELFAGHFWTLLALTVLVTVPLAAVSHRYLEAPVIAWGRRRLRTADTGPTTTTIPTPTSTSS